MSKIGKLNIEVKTNERKFPIDILLFKQVGIDRVFGGYEEWVCIANGFIIAHFISESCGRAYMNWLQKYGIAHFPKKIIDIIEAQHKNGYKPQKIQSNG